MFDVFRCATTADFNVIWTLYTDICAQMPNDAYSPKWVLNVFPSKEVIRGFINDGNFYVGFIDNELVAAMAFIPHEDPEYVGMTWPSGATGDEASVIHLLAAHPNVRGRHVGAALVQEAIRIARDMGKRAIHLDVVPENLAASRIYLAAGFKYVGRREIFYEDTGLMEFDMYELEL